MESRRFISHWTIQESLFRGSKSVNQILASLGIKNINNGLDKNLLTLISKDLHKTGNEFKVIKTDSLYYEGLGVSGFIDFKTGNRDNGGIIKLNKDDPPPLKLETLIHEYIHIKDKTIPILPMDTTATNTTALHYKPFVESIEFQVEITANSLMMPPIKIWEDLINASYNIDRILLKYKHLTKRTVLRWITLVDRRFSYHFACVEFEKNYNNEIIDKIVTESFIYDHASDPKPFDILAVLTIGNSAAAIACLQKKPDCVQKASNINGVDYYCYAYYETDLIKKKVSNNESGITFIKYDRLLVIGWKKKDFDLIQMYLS